MAGWSGVCHALALPSHQDRTGEGEHGSRFVFLLIGFSLFSSLLFDLSVNPVANSGYPLDPAQPTSSYPEAEGPLCGLAIGLDLNGEEVIARREVAR